MSEKQARDIQSHEGKKYLRTITATCGPDRGKSIQVDLYDILAAFDIDHALGHAVKKLLMPGRRGKGSVLADLWGADAALQRAIQMEEAREKARGGCDRGDPDMMEEWRKGLEKAEREAREKAQAGPADKKQKATVEMVQELINAELDKIETEPRSGGLRTPPLYPAGPYPYQCAPFKEGDKVTVCREVTAINILGPNQHLRPGVDLTVCTYDGTTNAKSWDANGMVLCKGLINGHAPAIYAIPFGLLKPYTNSRTRSQVLAERKNAVGGGCCSRFADNMGCDCLETALPDPE